MASLAAPPPPGSCSPAEPKLDVLQCRFPDEAYYAEQLSGILEHIDRLQQLDTEHIPPTAQVVEIASRLREDEPRPSLSQEEALANAPAAVNGMFRVPSIQEET